jgi:addiction module RelE/StbE family toxin
MELKRVFWNKMKIFSSNPLNPKLRTHKLTGNLKGLWAFSVTYDCRVIFEFIDKEKILLINIGGHDEVY